MDGILEIRQFLPLGIRATAAVDKARDYLKAMAALGKTPTGINLYAGDYDLIFNGVSRQHRTRYKDSGTEPPPHRRAAVQRHSGVARAD